MDCRQIANGSWRWACVAVPFFIIKPIISLPVLGDAGTSMSFLSVLRGPGA